MIIMFFLLGLLLFIFYLKSKKNMYMLQQNLYNENNRFIKWILKNLSIFCNIDLLALLLLGITVFFLKENILFFQILLLLCLGLYFLFITSYQQTLQQKQQKIPFVVTARIKRLSVTTCLLYSIPLILFLVHLNDLVASSFYLFFFAVLVHFNAFVLLLANTINKYTVEKQVYLSFRRKAVRKLDSMPQLKVVGITGSYGKTSSKMILDEILKSKYITRPTPKNLNTPYGLIITINNHLDKFDEVFLAEMGAYKCGEIKELCDLVHPQYGILTTIGTAHLESFGSEENIQKTKFELIESLPLDGIGILNRDDPKQVSYPLKNQCTIKWIGIHEEDVDVRATNIKCSHKGTTFDVLFKGEKPHHFQTKLLGEHNIYNILEGLALGKELGVEIKQLKQAVQSIKPIPHRLELKKIGNFYQIDDAYNSNPVGAKNACSVLKMMNGIKIVVTPGMVELGEMEDTYNQRFGETIAEVADYVILIGKKKTRPIYKGLEKKQFDMENVIIYNDVREAYQFISALKTEKDIYALFENDLPDTYNE